jgi:diacylglycerol kinase (ATP)
VYAYQEESAFRQELTLLTLLTPVALFLHISPLEKAVLITSLVMVLAVEAAIDRISFEHHDLSKRAKDFGSAAVMLTLLAAAMLWATICAPLVINS